MNYLIGILLVILGVLIGRSFLFNIDAILKVAILTVAFLLICYGLAFIVGPTIYQIHQALVESLP